MRAIRKGRLVISATWGMILMTGMMCRTGWADQPVDMAARHAAFSQGYSVSNKPVEALAEIEEALSVSPDNKDYLLARAQLANWLGRYQLAGDSYERLLSLTPAGSEYGLMLARARTWQGNLDKAVSAYRDYVKQHPDHHEALLEYARVEGWRGNTSDALRLLDRYEQHFPSQPKPDKDRARLLAWAGKVHDATKINDELLVKQPGDYELNVTRTVALDRGGNKAEAVKSLDTLRALRPDSGEVKYMSRFVESALRPDLTLSGRYYQDGDDLVITKEAISGGYSFSPSLRLGGAGEMQQLSAKAGSGLEREDGRERIDYQKVGIDAAFQFMPSLWANAAVGVAKVEDESAVLAYDLLLGIRPADSVKLMIEQERDSLLISPRSASLGIRRDTSQVTAEWTPGLDYTVVGYGRYDDLSDGNKRWEAALMPRRSVLRTQRFNLDLGLKGQMFGFDQDLNSGYYDPSFYELYALTAFSYLKITPESGLSLMGSAGYYKDDSMNRFDFGWSADGELILGAYSDWCTKLGGHYMQNFREVNGAYHAMAVDLALVRRF